MDNITIDGDITVTLVAVPEPGTGAMLIGGIGMLFVYQRRRRALRLG